MKGYFMAKISFVPEITCSFLALLKDNGFGENIYLTFT